MNILQFFVGFFAVIGMVAVGVTLGKWSYRVTLAIDELLEQRKKRKK